MIKKFILCMAIVFSYIVTSKASTIELIYNEDIVIQNMYRSANLIYEYNKKVIKDDYVKDEELSRLGWLIVVLTEQTKGGDKVKTCFNKVIELCQEFSIPKNIQTISMRNEKLNQFICTAPDLKTMQTPSIVISKRCISVLIFLCEQEISKRTGYDFGVFEAPLPID